MNFCHYCSNIVNCTSIEDQVPYNQVSKHNHIKLPMTLMKEKEIHLVQDHLVLLNILLKAAMRKNILKEIKTKIKKIIKKTIKKVQVKKMEIWKKLNQDFLKSKVINFKLFNNQKVRKAKSYSMN